MSERFDEVELAEFVNLVDDLLAYVEPCDIDPQRAYCVTHHERACESDVLVKELRERSDHYHNPGASP